MLELVILILDMIEKDPDNEVGPTIRELAMVMRRMPAWERKTEWKRLRIALKHRFQGRITAVDLIGRIREHADDLQDKIKG